MEFIDRFCYILHVSYHTRALFFGGDKTPFSAIADMKRFPQADMNAIAFEANGEAIANPQEAIASYLEFCQEDGLTPPSPSSVAA